MKKLLAILFSILFLVPVFALPYEIVDYSYEVSGKTKAFSLAEIVEDGDTVFNDEESLVKFLNAQRQTLLNKRLFNDIHYEYEVVEAESSADKVAVAVTFYVTDASSIFFMPYPKYDSNYGLKFGVKYYDHNFGGTFTDLYAYGGFTQKNNSFKEGTYDWELKLSGIRLGEVSSSVSHVGVIDLSNYSNTRLNFSFDVSNIKVGSASMSASVWARISPDSQHLFTSPWYLHSFGSSLGIKFNSSRLDNLSLSNSLTYYPRSYRLDSSTTVTHDLQLGLYAKYILSTKQWDQPGDTHRGFDEATIGAGVGRTFKLTKSISLSTLLMAYFDTNFVSGSFTPRIEPSVSSSLSRINWEGNFRKGYSYSTSLTFKYWPISGDYYTVWSGNVTGFYPIKTWFNLSSRMRFSMSDRAQTTYIGDYMRGIRLNNSIEKTAWKNSAILNLDLITHFIYLDGFCKTYAIPFVDLLVLNNGLGSLDSNHYEMTIGGEGIIILDNHPSYPIRGSLGFNAKDLLRFARGEIGLLDIEYELFIGLDFFY